MDESNAVKLRRIITLAIQRDPGSPASEVARTVNAREAALVAAWGLDQLTLFVRREINAKGKVTRPPGPYQMFLEGFDDLLERLPLPGRGRVALAAATIVDLRNSLKLTRLKTREQNQRTATLIKEMAPYAKTRRGLTVEGYLELRAAGVKARSRARM